ncbi:hypothetical protein F7725_016790 [Dissostichus mawsoni]|uniref:Uncharacterized protein n=1 Tax=Dissostichus mawsoni TaxID=36200 RepID=A0A7J5Z5J4_DISMA|nr:hypothetical protein F7725_016790 [Dissostichus mawsoni]
MNEETVIINHQRPNCQHDKCVLPRWYLGVWADAHLHLCIPQKGASHQQLAAVREERSLGRLLQSCDNRDAAAYCCGDFLFDHGLLHCLLEMIESDWTGKDTDGCRLGMDSTLWPCANPCCGTSLGLHGHETPLALLTQRERLASAAPFW